MSMQDAKNTNVRAHGPTRTLIFEKNDAVSRGHLITWLKRVNSLSRDAYESLLERIEERMRVMTKVLFPR